MRRKILSGIVTLTLFCLGVSPLLFAADYRFTKIDVPHSILTDARGINARGDIVGRYEDADGVSHGFLLRKKLFSSINVPGSSVTLGARAINARGDIVGSFLDADGVPHGYLLRDGQFTQIDYPGASGSFTAGINNAGDITGSHFDHMGNMSGFILKDGAFHNVHVPHSLTTDVFSAQDNGLVLVGYTMGPDRGFRGFIRTRPGDFQPIEFPGLSVPCNAARWINQRGDIVGSFAYVDSVDSCIPESPHHGFLLRGGQYTRVDFPGSEGTKVFAINDDGVIVGNFTDRRGNTYGFKAVPED